MEKLGCKYIVKARTVIKNEINSELQFNKVEESFYNINPIEARESAYRFYNTQIYHMLISLGYTDNQIGWNSKEYRIERMSNREIRSLINPYLDIDPVTEVELNKNDEFKPSHGGSWYEESANGIWLIFKIIDNDYAQEYDIYSDEDKLEFVIDSMSKYIGLLPAPPWSENLIEEHNFYMRNMHDVKHFERDIVFFDDEEHLEGDSNLALKRFTILETSFDWNGYDNPNWWKTEGELLAEQIREALDAKTTLFDAYLKGESETVEFKPGLINREKSVRDIELEVAQTIAAFANTKGGFLYIGIKDDGALIGLNFDSVISKDKFLNEFTRVKRRFLNDAFALSVTGRFYEIEDITLFVISVYPSSVPIFVRKKNDLNKNIKKFMVRADASNREMYDPEEMLKYCINKWHTKLLNMDF